MIDPLFQQILVPTDGSARSVEAGRLAFRVTRRLGGSVALLHVIEPDAVERAARYSGDTVSEARAKLARQAEAYLDHLEIVANEFGVQVQREIREGIPHEEITRLAHEIDADLIVMGHGGRRGPRRAIAGSVTERVLRFAPCPVLVVCAD